MAKDSDIVERLTPQEQLKALLAKRKGTKSRVAEENQAYGASLNHAVEHAHLNKKAFNMAADLEKMEEPRRSQTLRAFSYYIETFGLNAQFDLEDAIRQSEAEDQAERQNDGALLDRVLDGDPPQGFGEMDNRLLSFRTALDEQSDEVAVNLGLNRFLSDHSDESVDFKGEARMIAARRVAVLRGEDPDAIDPVGIVDEDEDVRPAFLRNRERDDEAVDAAQETKTRGRKRKGAGEPPPAFGGAVH